MSVDRFATLLYGIGEAAGYLALPPSTLTTWAYGYERRRLGTRNAAGKPIVTAVRPAHPPAINALATTSASLLRSSSCTYGASTSPQTGTHS
jgi:hypothetical protein